VLTCHKDTPANRQLRWGPFPGAQFILTFPLSTRRRTIDIYPDLAE
jgi:hypothetical protein